MSADGVRVIMNASPCPGEQQSGLSEADQLFLRVDRILYPMDIFGRYQVLEQVVSKKNWFNFYVVNFKSGNIFRVSKIVFER